MVAVGTFERIFSLAVRAALDVLGVHVAVVALERRVAGRVAVHAARVHQDLVRLQKGRARGGRRPWPRRADRRCTGATAAGSRPSSGRETTPTSRRRRGDQEDPATSRFIGFRVGFGHRLPSPALPERIARGFQAFFRSSGRIGSRRRRWPVTAKIALATAGATGGTPGSPTPPILSVVSTMWTSTAGISFIRRIG